MILHLSVGLRVSNMALSKLMDFSSKISFADCMDYGLESVSWATSIELIRGIIGGPNMRYKCIEINQSKYLYTVMQDNLIDLCQRQEGKFSSWNQGMVINLMDYWLWHSSQCHRSLESIWYCGDVSILQWKLPVVGFAHAFDMTGRGLLFVYILYYMWCLKIVHIHCTQVAIEWDSNKTNVDQNYKYVSTWLHRFA